MLTKTPQVCGAQSLFHFRDRLSDYCTLRIKRASYMLRWAMHTRDTTVFAGQDFHHMLVCIVCSLWYLRHISLSSRLCCCVCGANGSGNEVKNIHACLSR
jgi:hypothetical protein